jgi:hypothetical protein
MDYSASKMHPAEWAGSDLLADKHRIVSARAFKVTSPNNRLHERE